MHVHRGKRKERMGSWRRERETPNNMIYDAFKSLVEIRSVLGVHRKHVTG